MITFDTFKEYLGALHALEVKEGLTTEGSATLYNDPKQLAEGTFSYAYDGLCTEILRFNADGTISEWADAYPNDHEHYEPHFTHASVKDWMVHQIKAVTPPD